jgi:hypothetical protein
MLIVAIFIDVIVTALLPSNIAQGLCHGAACSGTSNDAANDFRQGSALSPLITLETARQGRSVLLSDEKRLLFES